MDAGNLVSDLKAEQAVPCAAQLRLSLTELDRRWNDILSGRVYHGEAINPKNLSLFTGVGKVTAQKLAPAASYFTL